MDYQFFGAQDGHFVPTYSQAAPLPLTPGQSASDGEFHSPSANDPMAYEFSGDPITFNNTASFHQQNQQAAFTSGALPAHTVFAAQNAFAAPTQQQKPLTYSQSQQPIASDFQKNAIAKAEPCLSVEPQPKASGTGSGDDDLTPAQNRRKAQNRAAQRAFRERKEKHVKCLEAKLASLEAAQKRTTNENERLKRDIQKISTENEILRATTAINGVPNGGVGVPSTTTGPLHFKPTEFYSNVLSGHPNKTPSHRIVESQNGERLYAAGATWDLIINHELFKQGRVDIGNVSDRLKHQAKCDGQGPVFEERTIYEAIEASVASGSDELI